jgi:hypothetical protein
MSREDLRKHATANGWQQRAPRSPIFAGDSFEKGDLWLDVDFAPDGRVKFGLLQCYSLVKDRERFIKANLTLDYVNDEHSNNTATVRNWIEGKVARQMPTRRKSPS